MAKQKKGWLKNLISRSKDEVEEELEANEEEPETEFNETEAVVEATEAPQPDEEDIPLVAEIAEGAVEQELPREDKREDREIEPADAPEEATLQETEEIVETTGQEISEDEVEDHETATEVPEEKKGLFRRFRERLSKTRSGLVDRVKDVIAIAGTVDEQTLEDIEGVLIQADVGVDTTTKIVDRMRKAVNAKRAETPEQLINVFQETISEIVSHDERRLRLHDAKPTIMLVVGVNGTGKTTTIGKLAKQYRDQGKNVCLVAADTFRAAAVEQLTHWAEKTDSKISKKEMGSDPASVCYEALAAPDISDYDLVLIDTAGRLHTKTNLMEELSKIKRVIRKIFPEAPHETLLVLDATTGQNAMAQAQTFTEAVDVTGFIMTKMDGTAKGGILVALRDHFDVPVLKIGIGEGEEDLRDFDPEAFVAALFAS
ncbi:MAG: signal recognition particle-docking protein FtsY [Candidatus Sumerlaeota bacterium]